MMSKLTRAVRNPRSAAAHVLRLLGLRGPALGRWPERDFAAPSPHYIKQKVLLRNGLTHATWVETGTFRGDTADVLSKVARKVYTIEPEPEPELHAAAVRRFQGSDKVEVLRGTSETELPKIMPRLHGAGPACFWLDGHYSGGETFKGEVNSPIVEELKVIGENLDKMSSVVVMVDDIRYFHPTLAEKSGYPTIDFLVDWARQHGMVWHIEHDIFVARRNDSGSV